MATRSFIAIYDQHASYEVDNERGWGVEFGVYTSIYCHWDGYPQGVGVTLRDCYTTTETVNVLMKFGDISSLRDTLFETQKEAYKLRGDENTEAKTFRFMSEMVEYYRNMSCEYGYIWSDGQWSCYALDPQEINLSEMESFANA